MKCLCPCLVAVSILFSQRVEANSSYILKKMGRARTVVEILEYQSDSIENWIDDRVYLCPARIEVARDGVFISDANTAIPLPPFALDEKGVFILCSREEAQEHYDRAGRALIEGFGHAVAAGASAECPPIAIYEGYQSVRSFLEFGNEYSKGYEKEHGGTVDRNRDD
jgi:hypothetical protein